MNEYTLPSQMDVFGFNQLKNFGNKKCAITDFAILLGGYVSSTDYVEKKYVFFEVSMSNHRGKILYLRTIYILYIINKE